VRREEKGARERASERERESIPATCCHPDWPPHHASPASQGTWYTCPHTQTDTHPHKLHRM
jgi:hypothetical protein